MAWPPAIIYRDRRELKALAFGTLAGAGDQDCVRGLLVVPARFVWRKLHGLAILFLTMIQAADSVVPSVIAPPTFVGVPRPEPHRFRSTRLAIAQRPAKVDPNQPL
jgi:hypothetical protein